LRNRATDAAERKSLGCPTHSWVWNEWETKLKDSLTPTHSKTANMWGTRKSEVRGA